MLHCCSGKGNSSTCNNIAIERSWSASVVFFVLLQNFSRGGRGEIAAALRGRGCIFFPDDENSTDMSEWWKERTHVIAGINVSLCIFHVISTLFNALEVQKKNNFSSCHFLTINHSTSVALACVCFGLYRLREKFEIFFLFRGG